MTRNTTILPDTYHSFAILYRKNAAGRLTSTEHPVLAWVMDDPTSTPVPVTAEGRLREARGTLLAVRMTVPWPGYPKLTQDKWTFPGHQRAFERFCRARHAARFQPAKGADYWSDRASDTVSDEKAFAEQHLGIGSTTQRLEARPTRHAAASHAAA